jgi:hypothetical protein
LGSLVGLRDCRRDSLRCAGAVAVAAKTAYPAIRADIRDVLLQLQRKQPIQQFVQISETPSASFVTFVLEPGLTRSEGERGVEIKVPPGTELVRFELTLPYPGRAETYHVVVGTPERPAVWDGAASPDNAMAVVNIPAKVLLAGDYTLELQADGKDLATYCFRVAK